MEHHRLEIVDRGVEHVHRWRAACSCGLWTGRNHRLRKYAVQEYRRTHGMQVESSVRRRRVRVTWDGHRFPTPREQLPAELR